ncbi:glycine cleavage system protein H, partial [Staphylococcus haemolyticus]
MAKLANYLYVEKVGNQYIYLMTPELQDDVCTVGYLEFMGPDDVNF